MFSSSHLDPQLDVTEEEARRQAEEDRQSGRRRRYSWDFDPYMEIFQSDLVGNDLVRLTDSPGYDAEGEAATAGGLESPLSLRERLGDALMSRLYEMCEIVEIKGPDFRKEVHKAGKDFHRTHRG